jgi:predicted nucleotidyltransferase
MTTLEQIEELGRDIGREFYPHRVMLFGSYAYGEPSADSDVDILVIMPHEGKGWRVASEIRGRLRPRFPLDLLVRTPEELRRRLALGDCFLKEIMLKGKVLYEAPDN